MSILAIVRMWSVRNIYLLVVLSVLIQSCGFKLRGNVMVDPRFYPIYIQVESNVIELVEPLKIALERQNVILVDSPSQARTIIRLVTEQFTRRVLTVSNQGKVQEYALNYYVDFDVMGDSGKVLLEITRLEIERDLRFDDSEVLAKSTEEATIHQHMLEDSVQQLLRRMQSLQVKN